MTNTQEPKRLRDLKSGVRDCIMLAPSIILVEPDHNPRDYTLAENREHLDRLKASIRVHGVKSPLWVRFDKANGGAILVDGECRLRAVLELIAEGVPIESVPTLQVDNGDPASRLALALTANNGKPLSEWEDGAAFRKLIAFGWSEEKIGEETGHPVRYIRRAVELSDAPQGVKRMLSEGTVTPALALKTLREKGSAAAEVLQEKVDAAKASTGAGGKVKVKRERVPKGKKLSDEQAKELTLTIRRALGVIQELKGPDLIDGESASHPELIQELTKGLELLA